MSAFIEAQKAAGFAVELVCRTLGVSRSAHYERASGRRSPRRIRDEQLVTTIRALHEANFEAYGYRKMHLALRRAGIEDVGRDRVKRLMRAHGIQGAKRRGKSWRTTVPDPDATRRPDLVCREFTATGPDRLYVADFTYLRCWEGLLFFAFVIDVYSRRVVGWQLTGHMRASLVCDALRMAVCTRPRHGADVELVHHSDRGSEGGFKWCSQHLECEGLRWERRGGVGLIGSCERRCVRPGVRRWRGVRIGSGFGRRSPRASRVTAPGCSPASRAWLASGGFVRVAGCDRSAARRCRGATCPLPSVRKSRC